VTTRVVLEQAEPAFVWLDVVHPSREELAEVARRYALHPTSVQDCLDPEHLPKYERIGTVSFIIVRAVDAEAPHDGASMQDMTRKVAVFFGAGFLITIHRKDQPFLTELEAAYRAEPANRDPLMPRLLLDLINAAIATYERPLGQAETAIGEFETTVFQEEELTGLLRRIYLEKRRVSQMKRMLLHMLDTVVKLLPAAEASAPLYQDLRENAQSMYVYADELLDDVNILLSIQLALASHRTNEVVRVLTVFSVFFLPLTFIVGVYGMNFRFMPELGLRWGYPAVWVVMAAVTLAIYLWFRRRGWLKG
jgi:magnesium transporter